MKYFLLTLKHKWFVFLAGWRTRTSLWDLLIHDWSKFMPDELPHYQRQFFGKADRPLQFAKCWLRHQNRHPHHWEYWIPRTGHTRGLADFQDGDPLPMPMRYVREMVADWLGAGRAYEGKWPDMEDWTWLKRSLPKMRLHLETKDKLQKVLSFDLDCYLGDMFAKGA